MWRRLFTKSTPFAGSPWLTSKRYLSKRSEPYVTLSKQLAEFRATGENKDPHTVLILENELIQCSPDLNQKYFVNFRHMSRPEYARLVDSTFQLRFLYIAMNDGEEIPNAVPQWAVGSAIRVGVEGDWSYFVTADHNVAEFTKENPENPQFSFSCDRRDADRKRTGLAVLKLGRMTHDVKDGVEICWECPERDLAVFRVKMSWVESQFIKPLPWPKNEHVSYVCATGYRARKANERGELDMSDELISFASLNSIYGGIHECCLSATCDEFYAELKSREGLSPASKLFSNLNGPWEYDNVPANPLPPGCSIRYHSPSVGGFSGGAVCIRPGTFSAVTVSGIEGNGAYGSLIVEEDELFGKIPA